MKIAYILTMFPCPSELFAIREIDGLRKQGIDITVFAARGSHSPQIDTEQLDIIYRPYCLFFEAFASFGYMTVKYPLFLLKLCWLLLSIVRVCPREAVTLVRNIHTICYFASQIKQRNISHIHAYFMSWPACIGMAVSKITNIPFSISAHARDIFVEYGALEVKVAQAQFITCCTNYGFVHLKAALANKYHHKLHLHYHGLHMETTKSSSSTSPIKAANTILAAGRLVKKKGFINLLEAFSLVLHKLPQCLLIIAGDGPQQQALKKLTDELHLTEHVHFAGWLNNGMMLRIMEEATTLVVPSIIDSEGDRDGIPNVILEAFQANTPVIASNLDGITEAIRHEQTGLLVKAGNVPDLAQAIVRLLNSENLRIRLSQNARLVLETQFDESQSCKQLAALFRNRY
jgi:colanic acid/amylovoran biosynthesis glycosyltransferase